MKRLSPILLTVLLLVSCFPINYASASGESTTISSFTGGFASVEVDLQGGMTDSSATIEVPRNVTFQTSFLNLDVDHGEDSPGQVWIDLNEDGIFEWDFSGTGYGNIGHQEIQKNKKENIGFKGNFGGQYFGIWKVSKMVPKGPQTIPKASKKKIANPPTSPSVERVGMR